MRCWWVSLSIAAALALVTPAALLGVGRQPQQPGTAVAARSPQRTMLDRYCVTCHNQQLKTADLTLDTMDVANVAAGAEVWERVVRKVKAGLMPPAGRPRPDRREFDEFAKWLEGELDHAASVNPNPGRSAVLHRLNRTEYANAIRDLLALEIDVAVLLPADDASYGFDNIASSLRMSPTLLDRYFSAARKISRAAVGRSVVPPSTNVYRVPVELSQERHLEGLPFGTRGGTLVRHRFPQDGEYVIQVKLALDVFDNIPRYDESHELEIMLDGEPVERFTLLGEPDAEYLEENVRRSSIREAGARRNLDADWRVRLLVKAGVHEVAATFLEQAPVLREATRVGALSRLRVALKEPLERPYAGGFFNDEQRSGPYLARLTVTGPFLSGGASDTPSRSRIFTCTPAAEGGEAPCAEQILSSLARHAYRRPPSDVELQRLLTSYRDGRSAGGFEAGIEVALRHLLVEPAFLFRIERDPPDIAPNTTYRVTDLDLASRLSFFLWSSIPDEALLDVAERGRLSDPAMLQQQVRRMLADRRSEAFVTNFTGQWLYLRNLPEMTRDLLRFPDFDENLRRAFRRETELFFESILQENRSVLALRRRSRRCSGLPRARGDGPIADSSFRISDQAPPCARGDGPSRCSVRWLATRAPPRTRGWTP